MRPDGGAAVRISRHDQRQPRASRRREARDASACSPLVPMLVDLAAAFRARPSAPIASAIDGGLRIAGIDVPQRGQAGFSDPMPHRPFVFDCLTTKKPTSTAAIASAMKPMPSMVR